MGQLSVTAQIKKMGVPIISYSGNVPSTLIDPRTNEIITTLSVSGAAAIPTFSLAKLPPASMCAIGSVINIPKSEFANNLGIPEWGIYLRTDTYAWCSAWAGQIFSAQDGGETTPLIDGFNPWSVNSDLLIQVMTGLPGGNPIIPWQLMRVGMKLEIEATFGFKTATQLAVFNILFGKSNNALNPSCARMSAAYSANRQVTIKSEIVIKSSTSYTCKALPVNAIYASANANEGNVTDRQNSLDWSSGNGHYICFAVDPSGSETLTTTLAYNLYSYKVRLM